MAPVGLVDVEHRAARDVARVVDEDVHRRRQPRATRFTAAAVAQIRRVQHHLDRTLRADRAARAAVEPPLIARDEMQVAAFRRERMRAREPDALRAAGDEDVLCL